MSFLLAAALLAQNASATWLIIEEGGNLGSHDELNNALLTLGEPFDVLTGKQISAMTAADLFASYEVVYIGVDSFMGAQITDPDVTPLIKTGGVVSDFVSLGGILFVHGAHNERTEPTGPGGSLFRSANNSAVYDDLPVVSDPDHEFIQGDFLAGNVLVNKDFQNWGSSCHGAVEPPPTHVSSGGVNLGTNPVEDQWNEILFSTGNKAPAMLEYTYGCGYVIMDMMIFDWDLIVKANALVLDSAAYVQGIQGNFPFCDTDGDGILNTQDNCPDAANPLQEDTDGDGIGDACDPCDEAVDPDSDHDGVCDSDDQCPDGSDVDDGDGDGTVDGCDLCPVDAAPGDDVDVDGVCNSTDICPDVFDPLQEDGDADGMGDACDACFGPGLDTDRDGIPDACDVCPLDRADRDDNRDDDGVCNFDDRCPNGSDFLDDDLDGVPNGCDPCPLGDNLDSDKDQVCDYEDICLGGDDLIDRDADGVPNDCDSCPADFFGDTDGDGSCDSDDPCQGFDDAIDRDGDFIPDQCDLCPDSFFNDADDDGSCNEDDICAGFDDFKDKDDDGLPDGCDNCPADPLGDDDDDGDSACNTRDQCPGFDDYADRDADAVPDGCDLCPSDADPTQRDGDGDGFGAACDCDDDDASVNPLGVELCDDGKDNDCDGAEDGPGAIGEFQFFADLDGDGQGAPGTLINACGEEAPANASTNGNDCDDANPLIFTGAREWCDSVGFEVDSDCDGEPSNGLDCSEDTGVNVVPPPTSCGSCAAAGTDPTVSVASLIALGALLARRRKGR